MRKIPSDLENPIDNVLYDLTDWMCPFFYKTGHTPNMITTYSLMTGLLSCYFLWKGRVLLFGIFYAISFFFDRDEAGSLAIKGIYFIFGTIVPVAISIL